MGEEEGLDGEEGEEEEAESLEEELNYVDAGWIFPWDEVEPEFTTIPSLTAEDCESGSPNYAQYRFSCEHGEEIILDQSGHHCARDRSCEMGSFIMESEDHVFKY